MRRLSPAVLFALLACSGGGETKKTEAQETEPKTRAARCEAIVESAGRQAVQAMGVMSVALGGDAQETKAAVSEARSGMGPELSALSKKCLEWPERTLKCFDQPVFMGLHGDECERLVAEALGHPVPLGDVKPGPEPSWSYDFPAKPDPLLVREDGWMMARTVEFDEDYKSTYRLTAVRNGERLWEVERDSTKQIVDLGARGIAVIAEGSLEFLDPDTGNVKTRLRPDGSAVPGFDAEYDSKPFLVVVSATQDALWVGDSEARFYRLKDDDSFVFDGQLADESLDSGTRLWIAGERRMLWESYDFRVFDDKWALRGGARAHDLMSVVDVHEGVPTLLVDDELVQLNVEGCVGPRVFAASKWPHRGDMIAGDECEECVPAPDGCVAWSVHMPDVSSEAPGHLPDGGLVVSDGEQTYAFRDGSLLWSVATGAAGSPAIGRDVHVFSVEEGRRRVWSLDARSGEVRWATVLPGNDDWGYSTDKIHVRTAGPWLFAGYGANVVGLALTRQ